MYLLPLGALSPLMCPFISACRTRQGMQARDYICTEGPRENAPSGRERRRTCGPSSISCDAKCACLSASVLTVRDW